MELKKKAKSFKVKKLKISLTKTKTAIKIKSLFSKKPKKLLFKTTNLQSITREKKPIKIRQVKTKLKLSKGVPFIKPLFIRTKESKLKLKAEAFR